MEGHKVRSFYLFTFLVPICVSGIVGISALQTYQEDWSTTTRHLWTRHAFLTASTTAVPLACNALERHSLNDGELTQLKLQKSLGQGAYKTVYQVASSSNKIGDYALSVEKVRSKTEAYDARRGIRIAQQLQEQCHDENNDCLERVLDAWFQDVPPVVESQLHLQPGTLQIPSRFVGRSYWLVAVKPLYDMDLARLMQRAPTLYPVGTQLPGNTKVGGLELQRDALSLAYRSCQAGAVMHGLGLIHRDIKLKNIMLHQQGKPVSIDFGFAKFVDKDRCIDQPGKIKGDPDYMLARDATNYQGCREGDAYAMGKTLYEAIFDGAPPQSTSSRKMNAVDRIRLKEQAFRQRLASKDAGTSSRFALTIHQRDTLLAVLRGLCDERCPLPFAESASYLAPWV